MDWKGYRYTLSRRWLTGDGCVAWVCANPSTADDTTDDHTVRCITRFSQDHGFQAFELVNLFAARATDPAELVEFHEAGINIEGVHNREYIAAAIASAQAVVFAWGAGVHPKLLGLAHEVAAWALASANAAGLTPMCLGTTATGAPRHPSRLTVGTQFTAWSPPGFTPTREDLDL